MFNSRLIPSIGFMVYEMTEQLFLLPVVLFSPVSIVSQILHTLISLSTTEDLKTPQVMSSFNKAYLSLFLSLLPISKPLNLFATSCFLPQSKCYTNTNVYKQTSRAGTALFLCRAVPYSINTQRWSAAGSNVPPNSVLRILVIYLNYTFHDFMISLLVLLSHITPDP